jgi:hypothetical protein
MKEEVSKKICSYRSFNYERIKYYLDTIPDNFQKHENYIGNDKSSILHLLYAERRFDTGDFYFMFDGDHPIACSGYHKYDDTLNLVGVRTYTWPNYRPGTWHMDIIIPIQICKLLNSNGNEIAMTVNQHNRRIFKVFNSTSKVGLNNTGSQRKNNLLKYLKFGEHDVTINNVPQMIAKFDIFNYDFQNSELPKLREVEKQWKIL